MILKINKKETKILVNFADVSLDISKESEDWNDKGINNFLIQLSSKTPENDDIIVEYDQEEKDSVYKHIVHLFKTFANTYNEDKQNIN